MTYNLDFTSNVARFAFIFLIYILITSGYISEILSCQMRTFLQNRWYARHILAIILVFAFIMFEGGWDFDKERENKESNNWASGNTIHSLVIAFIIYTVFLVSSKSKLIPNIIFFSLLFVLYMTNTYREYQLIRGEIDESTSNNIISFEQIIFAIALIILVFGFIEYYLYQKEKHEKTGDFRWFDFIVGTTKCNDIHEISSTIDSITKAIKNITNENENENEIFQSLEKLIEAIKNISDENKNKIFNSLVTMNELIKNKK
jgi:hypothetical protein